MAQYEWLRTLAQKYVERSSAEDVWGRPLLDYYVTPTLANARGEVASAGDAVRLNKRFLIFGGAGSGKTTLFRALTVQLSQAFLQGSGYSCPIFVRARMLGSKSSFVEELISTITGETQIEVSSAALEAESSRGRLHLLVDGLDEIDSKAREAFLKEIIEWGMRFSDARIGLSSRPLAITYSFSGYSVFTLAAFDSEQIELLTTRLAADSPENATRFHAAINEHRYLAGLATNPLLLRLLWTVFEYHAGRIPTNPAFLYSDFTDYLLSTWDQAKGIGPRSMQSLQVRHAVLERLALRMFQADRLYADKNDLVEVADLGLGESREKIAKDIAEWIEATGLLHRDSAHTYSFVHKSFLEYYVARAVRDNLAEVIHLLDRPDAREIIIFSCGLLDDIAPLIEAAVDRGLVVLAARCISNGRTRNRQLSEYVVHEFTREIGRPFVDLLVEIYAPDLQNQVHSDEFRDVLELWERSVTAGQPSHIKGSHFEDFAEAFFGKVFKVVQRDLNTENGELDLVVELGRLDPFWFEFGGDALIECKNWNSNAPLKEVGAFVTKVNQGRVKLGFFVSVSGFTEDAIRTLKNVASNTSAPLVVPLSGDQIKRALMRGEVLEEFFKEAIRSFKYLRKY